MLRVMLLGQSGDLVSCDLLSRDLMSCDLYHVMCYLVMCVLLYDTWMTEELVAQQWDV